jgi:geranylgeranyl diphosphate synthase type II
MPDMATLLEEERGVIEEALDRWLPDPGEYPERIHEAIRYSALSGGKRLRPIIALAATRTIGLDGTRIIRAACAVEYVHCCSLVLDDLPSMDDAMMRRGRPTTHRAFGVATAILAADALLMHAFKLVADNGVDVGASGSSIARAVTDLATAVGSFGMVGGQHVDLEVAGRETVDADTLEYIQSRKTGSLFVVSATVGGTLLGAPERRLAPLRAYARNLGLSYQITDDLLDAEGDARVVGKDVGQDEGKNTFVTVHGPEAARRTARRLAEHAKAALRDIDGDPEVLGGIANYCLERTR